jgi:hypothetical protein
MPIISKSKQQLNFHPLNFTLGVLRNFSKNQGLLLAGAVAYYALLLKIIGVRPQLFFGGKMKAKGVRDTLYSPLSKLAHFSS